MADFVRDVVGLLNRVRRVTKPAQVRHVLECVLFFLCSWSIGLEIDWLLAGLLWDRGRQGHCLVEPLLCVGRSVRGLRTLEETVHVETVEQCCEKQKTQQNGC